MEPSVAGKLKYSKFGDADFICHSLPLRRSSLDFSTGCTGYVVLSFISTAQINHILPIVDNQPSLTSDEPFRQVDQVWYSRSSINCPRRLDRT
jgi:hypothetical protein